MQKAYMPTRGELVLEVFCLIFVSFGRLKKKPTKETASGVTKMLEEYKAHGIKIREFLWTLGRYDTVMIFEARDEKVAMEMSISASDVVATETMVAVTREEAMKLL
jgi:uncharacterized protein with GYD domain